MKSGTFKDTIALKQQFLEFQTAGSQSCSYVITTHFCSTAGEKLQNAEEGRGKPQEYNVSGLFLADNSNGAFYPSPLLRAPVIRAVNGQEREGEEMLS